MTMQLAQRPQQASAFDLFNPERYAVLERMAATLLASKMLPTTLTQPAQVITIMLKSYELGVPPLEGLNGIAVIQGKPTVSPQLMLALIERSGAGSISILERTASVSVVEAHRRGRKPVQFTFTFADATALGLHTKDNYKKQPAVMLQWRNVAAAARAVFPDVISGLYLPEEMGVEVEILEDGAQIISAPLEQPTDTTFTPAQTDSKPARANVLGTEPITVSAEAPVKLESIASVTKGTAEIPSLTDPEKLLIAAIRSHALEKYKLTESHFDAFASGISGTMKWKNPLSVRVLLETLTTNGQPDDEKFAPLMADFVASLKTLKPEVAA